MQSVSKDTFGPLIAYLVPGAVALLGLSPFIPAVKTWFAATPGDAPTIGGFLYLTVASLAVGMTVSAIRWAIVDSIHARTGLTPPPLDFSRLGSNVEAMELLIEIHYRHYLFFANMLIASAIAWIGYRTRNGWSQPFGVIDLVFLVLEPIFLAASRDTLRRYYFRCAQVFPTQARTSSTRAPVARRTQTASSRTRPVRSATE